jgi:hypothetical protein
MNPNDVSQLPLRDIHLPAGIGWWPPAPGWWLLLALAVGAVLAVLWRYRSRYRERAALRGLKAVAKALSDGGSPGVCIQRISMIVRRFAMSVAGAQPVAGLTGEAWLRFLDSRWARDEFSAGIGRVLIFGPYAPPERVNAGDVSALNELCIDWVRAQRPQEQ